MKIKNNMDNINNNNNKELQPEQFKAELDQAFDALPEKVQDFITGDEYVNIIEELEKTYSLTENETKIIQFVTLLGLLHIYLNEKIKSELILALRNRSAAEAEKIIKEIEEKILSHR